MPAEGLSAPGRLGLVAGGGPLPVLVAQACREAGRPLFVLRLQDFADPALAAAAEGAEVNLGEWGRALALLTGAGCRSVCFVGSVARPDFARLRFDALGSELAPALLAAAREGDDALLRAVAAPFAAAGLRMEGAHEIVAPLLIGPGALGRLEPEAAHLPDIARALAVARALGRLDVGQGAVAAGGLVLAVEAQEGTDAMLARVAALPPALRGSPEARRGVLAKAPKPIQDRRLDLPVIGRRTLEGAAAAGLAGVAVEAGGVLGLDRDSLAGAADALGLFIWGAPPEDAA